MNKLTPAMIELSKELADVVNKAAVEEKEAITAICLTLVAGLSNNGVNQVGLTIGNFTIQVTQELEDNHEHLNS